MGQHGRLRSGRPPSSGSCILTRPPHDKWSRH
jgi:hypothetical protein